MTFKKGDLVTFIGAKSNKWNDTTHAVKDGTLIPGRTYKVDKYYVDSAYGPSVYLFTGKGPYDTWGLSAECVTKVAKKTYNLPSWF